MICQGRLHIWALGPRSGGNDSLSWSSPTSTLSPVCYSQGHRVSHKLPHLPLSILTATVLAWSGRVGSMPKASAHTTCPKQPSPRGFPSTSLDQQLVVGRQWRGRGKRQGRLHVHDPPRHLSAGSCHTPSLPQPHQPPANP